jgi:spore maturation protein CgeB
MKILHGYSYFNSPAYPDVKKWHEEYYELLRLSGFNIDGFCLTLDPPGPPLPFSELDQRWQKRETKLMHHYENLLYALDGKDVLLNASGINLHPEFVESLPVFTVFQCFDDPENSDNLSKPAAYAYDLCLVGNVAEVDTYKSWGVKNVEWSPMGLLRGYYDPNITEKELFSTPRDIELFMIGDRLSPPRKSRMDLLNKHFPSAHFFGNGWPRGMLPLGDEIQYLRRSKIGPNIHNSTGPINFRLFALPANGVMQICDNKKYLGRVFVIGKEVVGFESIEECVDLCHYYLTHENERLEIAIAGWKRCLIDYTERAVFSRTITLIKHYQAKMNTNVSNIVSITGRQNFLFPNTHFVRPKTFIKRLANMFRKIIKLVNKFLMHCKIN